MPVQRIVKYCPYTFIKPSKTKFSTAIACPDFKGIRHWSCDYWDEGFCTHPNPSELLGHKLTTKDIDSIVLSRIKRCNKLKKD